MKLQDDLGLKPHAYGIFNIKSYDSSDNLLNEYEDQNLIVYTARSTMAGTIGSLVGANIEPINRFVLGTRGHIGENVLNHVQVGEEQPGLGIFDADRTELFSEESGEYNYEIHFNPEGSLVKTNEEITGNMRSGTTVEFTDTASNTIQREITGARLNEVKYTVTIEIANANIPGRAIPYTEAALYAGQNLFAMKTFPARVKENTVKFVITWSIIF